MLSLNVASAATILGQDPTVVTAWATVALAFVGTVGIVTGGLLAIAGWRQARAARVSNALQREELDALKAQLDLTRQEMALRSDLTAQERKRIERDAQVNLEVIVSGGQYVPGTPPRGVQVGVTVMNHGPGVADAVVYGIRRNNWEGPANERPSILGVGRSRGAQIAVPDEAVADASIRFADDWGKTFIGWARYVDATGAAWETTSDGGPRRQA